MFSLVSTKGSKFITELPFQYSNTGVFPACNSETSIPLFDIKINEFGNDTNEENVQKIKNHLYYEGPLIAYFRGKYFF
jgi:hypothetical protein